MSNNEIKPGLLCYWNVDGTFPYIVEVIKNADKEGYWECLGDVISSKYKDMPAEEIIKTDMFTYRSHIIINENELKVWDKYEGPPFDAVMSDDLNKSIVRFTPTLTTLAEFNIADDTYEDLINNDSQVGRAERTAAELNKLYRRKKEIEMVIEYFEKYAKV